MGNCLKKIEPKERAAPNIPLNITWEETEEFIAPVVTGRVIKVYDGDTITIASYVFGRLYRFSVRLAGIDTPEMRSHNPHEKQLAIDAQQVLSDLLLSKMVRLGKVQNEKYGRLLADVYVMGNESEQEIHVNQWMLDQNYAVPYNGGTKKIII